MCMHQDTACACTTLRKTARAVGRVYDEALAEAGMTTAQFAVLRHVARAGEPIPLSRLAEALVMDRSSLYRALAPIEAKGWIVTAAGQGKSRLAALTPAGAAALEGAVPGWEAAQKQIVGAMGKDMWVGLEFALRALTGLALKAH